MNVHTCIYFNVNFRNRMAKKENIGDSLRRGIFYGFECHRKFVNTCTDKWQSIA